MENISTELPIVRVMREDDLERIIEIDNKVLGKGDRITGKERLRWQKKDLPSHLS